MGRNIIMTMHPSIGIFGSKGQERFHFEIFHAAFQTLPFPRKARVKTGSKIIFYFDKRNIHKANNFSIPEYLCQPSSQFFINTVSVCKSKHLQSSDCKACSFIYTKVSMTHKSFVMHYFDGPTKYLRHPPKETQEI